VARASGYPGTRIDNQASRERERPEQCYEIQSTQSLTLPARLEFDAYAAWNEVSLSACCACWQALIRPRKTWMSSPDALAEAGRHCTPMAYQRSESVS